MKAKDLQPIHSEVPVWAPLLTQYGREREISRRIYLSRMRGYLLGAAIGLILWILLFLALGVIP